MDPYSRLFILHSSKIACSRFFPLTVQAQEGWVAIMQDGLPAGPRTRTGRTDSGDLPTQVDPEIPGIRGLRLGLRLGCYTFYIFDQHYKFKI